MNSTPAYPAEYRTYQKQIEGAPVSYHCPEPVPAAVSEMGIPQRRAEYQCGASIRQLVPQQRRANRSIRRRLRAAGAQRIAAPEFVPFADEILGKKDAFRDPAIEVEIQPKLLACWDELWLKSGGRRRGR